jgi:K+-sensing histidine kinase KdpD
MGTSARGRQSAETRLDRLIALQSLLARVSREIGPALELQPVLKTVLGAMRSMVDFRGGTIQLVDERGCYIAASDPDISAELAATRVPLGSGISGRAVVSATTVYVPDLDTDRRVDPVQRRTGGNATTHSYLVVPLMVLGECIGLLQVDSDEVDAFDTEDITVLEGLATQVAGAIESARRYERMLELERLKDDFIDRVSHELRTPLTIMIGFTDTLLTQDATLAPEVRHDALERIKAAINRLRGLLDEILYVSSLNAGTATVRREQITVADVAEEVRQLSTDPGLVTVDVAEDVRVEADPLLLRHILTQLVDNAIKYGGDATISAGQDAATGELVVSVRDHGPGIPDDRRRLIFERFWRGQHPVAGMGLGLATVRQLSASIGATVDIVDPPGRGAQVNVRFG